MELWIRSQDKRTLINTKRIDVDDTNIIVWDEGRYASEIYLGQYKTKERALEVLDEIQSIIRNKLTTNIAIELSLEIFALKGIQNLLEQMAVYEMPEK